MFLNLRKAIGAITLCAFGAILLIPQCLFAEDHIVKASDLQQAVVSASQVRQERVNDLNQFFASSIGKQVLKRAKVDSTRVQTAIPQLNDAELARLDSQVKKAQSDFAAGGEFTAASWVALGATVGFVAWWLHDQTFAN